MMTQEQMPPTAVVAATSATSAVLVPAVVVGLPPPPLGSSAMPPPSSSSVGVGAATDYVTKRLNTSSGSGSAEEAPCSLERDYYGCYCLKFIVKNGTHITEDKVVEDFGAYGDVVDVRGPGLFSGLRGNHVYVRFIDRQDAEIALKQLAGKYHQLTPASISDVLPDNYGLYTISFYNKTGIPSNEVRREFSKFGEVKNLTGSLDVKGGRVFVSYKNKDSAVQALQAFFFRKDRYPNMKFALPRCEKDYFGCYCLKFYNKTGEMTYDRVLEDFGQYGEVVDVRGPGLFDVTGDDVYVRYKEKSSAEQALIELVGKYDSLCLAPPSDIQADKFGYYTITFVNDKCLSKSDVWYIFSKFGTVACVNGTFDCKKGRVFVSYKEKQGALNALETMLITKEYHLQVSKNSTVRKNDYNIVSGGKDNDMADFGESSRHERASSEQKTLRDRSCSREASCGPTGHRMSGPPPLGPHTRSAVGPMPPNHMSAGGGGIGDLSVNGLDGGSNGPSASSQGPPPALLQPRLMAHPSLGCSGLPHHTSKNGLVKFNRNVEKDIFGYYCLSFLNDDGEISEKKVRTDFSKFGEVVSVRGALGKQKGHVFVRFRKKEAAENCLNCLNSFPLSEMSELFGRYLFLSPATPRDIDCDMYGLYSISFLNLNAKSFRDIKAEFGRFGEIVRLTSGGGGNTDELVSISYAEKSSAVKALQTHFTNKDYPYLDIAKGSSLLLVNSSESSDCEDHESDYLHHHHHDLARQHQERLAVARPAAPGSPRNQSTERPHHDPFTNKSVAGSDVVDELLKPLQSYFNVFRTGLYDHSHHHHHHHHAGGDGGGDAILTNGGPPAHNTRSHDKRYKIKKSQSGGEGGGGSSSVGGSGSHGGLAQPAARKRQDGVNENGLLGGQQQHHPHMSGGSALMPPPQLGSMPPHHPHHHHQVPPPSTTNGYASSVTTAGYTVTTSNGYQVATTNGYTVTTTSGGVPQRLESLETEIAQQQHHLHRHHHHHLHHQPPPNMAEPPPPFAQPPPPHQLLMLPPTAVVGHPPPGLLSPTSVGATPQPMFSTPLKELELAGGTLVRRPSQEQLELDISSMSIQDNELSHQEMEEGSPELDLTTQVPAPPPPVHITSLTKDLFNLYSLSCQCKSKDFSERRIRLDFGLVAEVCRVRGLAGRQDSPVIISFETEESALACLHNPGLLAKYPSMTVAPSMKVVPDRDGNYSIEFVNSGMSGVREITNEFSRHGELVKVHQGGAKNAVKRVTVSYTDVESAFRALAAYSNSKDVRGIDFVSECLEVLDDAEQT